MKLTLTIDGTTYSVEDPECGERLTDILRDLLVPVLLAAGFGWDSVHRAVDTDPTIFETEDR